MKLIEVFESIQGEARNQGKATTFIRLAYCNLQCTYCDTPYANPGNPKFNRNNDQVIELSIAEIMRQVRKYGHKIVEITGGEPLVQRDDVFALIMLLSREGYLVDLETNGTVDITGLNSYCRVIMDIKTPGSGMVKKMLLSNIEKLSEKDDLKFVVTSWRDMEWAKGILEKNPTKAQVYFSPCIRYGKLTLEDVAKFIIANEELNITYSLQIHKFIWDPNKRAV